MAAAGKRLQKIVDTLSKKYEVEGKKGELTELRDPFQVGAWYILGRHAKKNGQARAYEALRKAKGLTPGQVLDINPEKFTTICQTAGSYDAERARELYKYADDIEDKCGQEFLKIFKRPAAEARAFLMKDLSKSREFADFVMMYAGFPVFALDAKVVRVLCRLGYCKPVAEKDFEAKYADIQKQVEAEAPKETDGLVRVHGLLSRHANDVCHVNNPSCGSCPLLADCPFGQARPPEPPPGPEHEFRRTYVRRG